MIANVSVAKYNFDLEAFLIKKFGRFLPVLFILSMIYLSQPRHDTSYPTYSELKIQVENQPLTLQLGLLLTGFTPYLDTTDSVVGRDENENGVRDDIELFIVMLSVEDNIKNILTMEAKNKNEILGYDFLDQNPKESRNAANELRAHDNNALYCASLAQVSFSDYILLSSYIKKLVLNTAVRKKSYAQYESFLDPIVILLSTKATKCSQ